LQTASDNSRGHKDGTLALFKSFEKNKKSSLAVGFITKLKCLPSTVPVFYDFGIMDGM
jgi:hypothetical protein